MKLGKAVKVLTKLARGLPTRSGRVHVEIEQGVASIRFNFPEAHHALSVGMMVELAQIVEQLQSFDGYAVLLSSTGPNFCSGGYLPDVRQGLLSPQAGGDMCQAMTTILNSFQYFPFISLTIVEGAAVGGGAELSTATDLRWGSPQATIGFIHTSLGVAPGWGGAERLQRCVGPSIALKWLVEGKAISAEVAQQHGFLHWVSSTPWEDAQVWLRSLGGRKDAIRAVKSQLAGLGEREAFLSVWGSTLHRQAIFRGVQ